MTHGVVICPKCNQAKACDLGFKSTKCLSCGYAMKLEKTKIWAKTDEMDEIPKLVGNVKAQMHNVEIIYPEEPKSKPKKKKSISAGSRKEKLVFKVALDLCQKNETFDLKDFHKALKKEFASLKKEDSERFIAFLQTKGVLIEPRTGTYRVIEQDL